MTKHSMWRWLSGAVLAASLVTVSSTPAHATVLDTDRPKITENGFDFGIHWDTIAAPRNGGHLYWDVTNGIVTPDLEGYLYLKNVASSCAKIQVEYHDDDHDVLALRESALHCAATNSMQQHWVDIDSYGSAYTTHVIVKLNVQNTNGTFSTVGSEVWHLGSD